MEQASWEPLAPGCQVLVTREHGFSTDTLLLAAFSQPRRGERCADLGTGCGTIPLLWRARGEPGPILAVELQPQAAEQARRSVERSGYNGHIQVVEGDVRDYKALLPCQGLDRVACNPPYTLPGAGAASPDPQRRAARQGDCFSLEDLAQAARYSLKHRGRLCLCLPVRRLAEALALFSRWDLEPKLLRLVQQRRDKAPYLFLLECRRGGRPGGLEAAPTLLLEEDGGGPARELLEVYGSYRDNAGWKTRGEQAP
ncbi:MAG TPA: methyltransferase [Candidatus Acutalibacter pullistercoris]|uniref:Methyltransferase n=1 Tax=Candidatus Acutalibacter pullistercoris TaxID=2838418 RepID=A0A9D1YBL3_9FIRM|nr:methyltransferase [Candidatus Acutalibacter pullistercoris]